MVFLLQSNLPYIIFGIVALHFIVGIAWLAYKIAKGEKKDKNKENKS